MQDSAERIVSQRRITKPIQGTIQWIEATEVNPKIKHPTAKPTPATIGAYSRASTPLFATLRLDKIRTCKHKYRINEPVDSLLYIFSIKSYHYSNTTLLRSSCNSAHRLTKKSNKSIRSQLYWSRRYCQIRMEILQFDYTRHPTKTRCLSICFVPKAIFSPQEITKWRRRWQSAQPRETLHFLSWSLRIGVFDLLRGRSNEILIAVQKPSLLNSDLAVYLPPSANPRSFRSLAARLRRITVARVSRMLRTTSGKYAARMTVYGINLLLYAQYLPLRHTKLNPLDPSPLQMGIRFYPRHSDWT